MPCMGVWLMSLGGQLFSEEEEVEGCGNGREERLGEMGGRGNSSQDIIYERNVNQKT